MKHIDERVVALVGTLVKNGTVSIPFAFEFLLLFY